MFRRLSLAGGLAVAVVVGAGPAAAQATIGVDAAVNSQYVWRGLTFSNKPVLEPDVWLSLSGFTAGAWANIDPAKCTGADDVCETGGARTGIAEIDYWLEYGRSLGTASVKVGWVAYTFNKDNVGGIDNTFNTSEIYGSVSLGGMPVTPSLGIWYDIDNVKGAYLEGGLSYGLKASPALTITLAGKAGFSAGQEVSASDPGANFAKSGLSHADFAASTSFSAGPISIVPALHFQWCNDDFTKFTGGPTQHSTKAWGGVTLSWSRALGGGSQ